MVNIIMPAYNAHETIRQAIASVAMQDEQNNIILTIVDDCSDESYDYLLHDFHYINIELLRKTENTGCGQSRQYGIDRCTCEYFMFLDTDDCLYSCDAVSMLHRAISEGNFNVVSSNFVAEIGGNEHLLFEGETSWMHGKIYRTEFVQKNNLRFNETRLHEDHAFNALLFALTDEKSTLDYITYTWRNNRNSLTRSCEDIAFSYESYFKNAKYTVSNFLNYGIEINKLKRQVANYILAMYGYYNQCMGFKQDFLIDKYKENVFDFLSCVPDKVLKSIDIEDFENDFYQNDVINTMVSNNIIFYKSFYDFLALFSIISKQERR